MRIQRLHIPAFGPFTDLELKFPSEGADFHVIYGPNEAGKSSLLRAIRDLLFGIHVQSPDNFLHDYKNLRLVGEIANQAGEQLVFQRRKGNKNTLLDEAGNSLPDAALLPFLGTVDQAYFSAMFGLGSAELREGAKQLLRGEGEIGTALFSASLGGTPIQRIQQAITAEAERLFKGRSTANVSIRPVANHYKDCIRQSRDSMVNAEAWDKLEKELQIQEEKKHELEKQLGEIEGKLAWLARCEDALPTVGRLKEEERQLAELPALPDVAADFGGRVQKARLAVTESGNQVQSLTGQLAQLDTRLAGLTTNPKVLAESEAVDVLHQDLGAYRSQKGTLTELQAKVAGLEPMLSARMSELEIAGELEALETLRLSTAVRLRCEEAAKALRTRLSEHDQSLEKLEAAKVVIQTYERELNTIPEQELTPLREALAIAAAATEADQSMGMIEAKVGNLKRKLEEVHALVLGAPKDHEATATLPVPAVATLRQFRDQFDEIHRDIKAEEKKIGTLSKDLKSVQAALTRLERRGALPSEADLLTARQHRDHGWKLVLLDWKGDGTKEELEPGVPLAEAFPSTITKADELADQLRQDAEAVAQAEEKRAQIQNLLQQLTETTATLDGLRESLKHCETSWESKWEPCQIKPGSPKEMEEWRDSWAGFKTALGELKDAEGTWEAKQKQVNSAREKLAAVLDDSPGKEFSVLFEAARLRVQQGEEQTGRREVIAGQVAQGGKDVERLQQNLSKVVNALETAKAEWRTICDTAGLQSDLSPETGLGLLSERKDLLGKFEAWKEHSEQVRSVNEAVAEYELRTNELAARLEFDEETVEALEAGLWKSLAEARQSQTKREQLTSQIGAAKSELDAAQQRASQAVTALAELVNAAGLNDPDELEPVLAHLEKREKIRGRTHDFRGVLSGLARGQTVEEFIQRVEQEDSDSLPVRREQIQLEQAEKKTELESVRKSLIELHQQRTQMEKAGDAAADFRQKAESAAATVKRDASTYMRLRLAAHFLQRQIEIFREQNQGPLLERSGMVFSQLTCGTFSGLEAEFNEQDVPVLVGRRPDGSNVPVEGMSEGTRDQLYLALRIAALDGHLADHEPMPLILDDLLMTFDNERVKAILPVLAELAGRTQILLFTHHQHLVELCQQTLSVNQFKLHHISAGSSRRS